MAAVSSIEDDYTLFNRKVKKKQIPLLDSDLIYIFIH